MNAVGASGGEHEKGSPLSLGGERWWGCVEVPPPRWL